MRDSYNPNGPFAGLERLISDREDEIEHMKVAFGEIWKTCHMPTPGSMKAVVHFQRDFDKIRGICAKYRIAE